MFDAIEVIHRDHGNINRVLSVMMETVDELGGGAEEEDKLTLLYSAIYYMRLYPDRCHHPKEEKYLFAALDRRCAEARDLIRDLEAEHAEGGRLIAKLDAALKGYDRTRWNLGQLRDAVHDYVAFQRSHMALEESELLPLARQTLAREEWGDLARAFTADSDPMFSENIETGYRALFDRITRGQGSERRVA